MATESFFNGEAGFEVGDIDIDAAGRWCDVEHQQVAFEGGNAIHAPGGIGEFLDELLFGRGFGFVLVEEILGVTREGGRIFGREQRRLAGESVGEGVER